MKKRMVLVFLAAATPACALDLNDSMLVWKKTPNALRIKLLADPAIATKVSGNNVAMLECMNDVKDTKILMEKTVLATVEECAEKIKK
jgi:hypothetical protein